MLRELNYMIVDSLGRQSVVHGIGADLGKILRTQLSPPLPSPFLPPFPFLTGVRGYNPGQIFETIQMLEGDFYANFSC
jgi:hypothetical protein